MIALYRFLEMFVVWMVFIDFAGVVPENKVILQRSLERFAHQVLKGDDPILSRQFLLNQFGPAVLGQQLLQFPLRLVEIFEIVRIHEQKLRKADHRLPDHRLSAIPLLKFLLQLFVQLHREADHRLHVGKHPGDVVFCYALAFEERLLYPVLDADQILPVVLLGGHQLAQPVVSVFGATSHLLPFCECGAGPQDEAQLDAGLLLLCIHHMHYLSIYY